MGVYYVQRTADYDCEPNAFHSVRIPMGNESLDYSRRRSSTKCTKISGCEHSGDCLPSSELLAHIAGILNENAKKASLYPSLQRLTSI